MNGIGQPLSMFSFIYLFFLASLSIEHVIYLDAHIPNEMQRKQKKKKKSNVFSRGVTTFGAVVGCLSNIMFMLNRLPLNRITIARKYEKKKNTKRNAHMATMEIYIFRVSNDIVVSCLTTNFRFPYCVRKDKLATSTTQQNISFIRYPSVRQAIYFLLLINLQVKTKTKQKMC